MNETAKDRDSADCTVVICTCGHVVYFGVTEYLRRDSSAAMEIGSYAIAGKAVKHMPAEWARRLTFGCRCKA